MEKMIEKLARDIHEATRRASKILVEETRAFVKQNHRYHSKNDFDKAHPKTLAELEAEYLTEQGYRKQVEAEWIYYEAVLTDDGFISVYTCSNCNSCVYEEDFHQDYFHKNYCGHCGAKIKGAE